MPCGFSSTALLVTVAAALPDVKETGAEEGEDGVTCGKISEMIVKCGMNDLEIDILILNVKI